MYKLPIVAAAAALGIGVVTMPTPVEAGPFDKIKKIGKKAEDTARDAQRAADVVESVKRGGRSGGPNTISGIRSERNARLKTSRRASAGRAPNPSSDLTSITSCSSLKLSNVMIGQLGDYTFQQGMSKEERSGLINRENVTPTGGCILPGMGTGDAVYFEVDKGQFEAMGNSNDWQLQCIDSKTRAQEDRTSLRPSMGNVSGKDVMLHTGNSFGYTPTATGTNSNRSNAWKKNLDRRGKAMISFNFPAYHMDNGTDNYCQYYHKPSGKSLVAFQWRRSAG